MLQIELKLMAIHCACSAKGGHGWLKETIWFYSLIFFIGWHIKVRRGQIIFICFEKVLDIELRLPFQTVFSSVPRKSSSDSIEAIQIRTSCINKGYSSSCMAHRSSSNLQNHQSMSWSAKYHWIDRATWPASLWQSIESNWNQFESMTSFSSIFLIEQQG